MKVSVILFEGFELLDVFGPAELFSLVPGWEIEYVGVTRGAVSSSQGAQVIAELSFEELVDPEVILLPGGRGTRALVTDDAFITRLSRICAEASWVTSVCTGSALLAAAGLLDGYRATGNKRAFEWVKAQGSSVDWVYQARWVEDRNRWTSSGIAAGIDMAAALIEHIEGAEISCRVCEQAELVVNRDPHADPFAQ